ncbi:hypothetical protein [Klebsiella quasipneumoniae]|uniref:hypothetical protein n=1 Tax=Klebsiella quasipneumoniae TaxID=1463165 RepID=UPI00371EB76E
MSDPASDDKLTLEVLLSDGGLKIFICDFNKGVATLYDGVKNKQSKYILQGERDAGYINLVKDNTIECTLYGVKEYTYGKGALDKSSPVFCSLCEGQIQVSCFWILWKCAAAGGLDSWSLLPSSFR